MQYFTCYYFVFISTLVYSIEEDYYWRDYNGTIPSDAVVVGTDATGKNLYVGQGVDKNDGLLLGEIKEGYEEIQVPYSGVRKMKKDRVKILCGSENKFYWLKVTNENAHLVLLEHRGVVGGHESGVLGVGRIKEDNEHKIGKVVTFKLQDNSFHYANKGKEGTANSYEILCFQDRRINPRSV